MSQTVLTIDAETGKALQNLSRVARSMKNIEKSTRDASKAAKQQKQDIEGMGAGLAKVGRMMAGAAGFAGAGAALMSLAQGLREAGSRRIEFEKLITPLVSLGDNVKNIRAIREQVLNLSTAIAQGPAEAAEFLFQMQSATGGLSDKIKSELQPAAIQLHKLTGADLPTAFTVLAKSMSIYGDQIESVTQASNKLDLTAQRGVLTFQEMATLLPDVLPAAKAMGHSFEEVLGTLITATQTGGKTEKTFTGVRNIFLRLADAQSKGVELTGTFVQKLDQLNKVDASVLKKIFGDEAISVAASLRDATGQLATNLKDLEETAGNMAKERNLEKALDAGARGAEIAAIARQGAENALLAPMGEGTQKMDTAASLSLSAARRRLPEFLRGGKIEKLVAGGIAIGHVTGSGMGGTSMLEQEVQRQAQQMALAGEPEKGMALLSEYGLAPGTAEGRLKAAVERPKIQAAAAQAELEKESTFQLATAMAQRYNEPAPTREEFGLKPAGAADTGNPENTQATRENTEAMRELSASLSQMQTGGAYTAPGSWSRASMPTPKQRLASAAAPE